ncbi:g6335 [Coccomyxa elongata]
MGKHNGKARKAGLKVGAALSNRHKGGGLRSGGKQTQGLHTTEQPAMQSVLEVNDLTELMTMAELAERDFTAEKGEVIVISTGAAVDAKAEASSERERRAAEERNRHRLRIPRRPAWRREQSPEEVDAQERAAFLAWRRELAAVEATELLVLTPFEKNLEVWRQLWRVLERSHIVVQVLDARDPLRYRSEDMEEYARELHPAKASLMLLNKADLLPRQLREAWADYFEARGIDFIFWSAKAATERALDQDAVEIPAEDAGTRTEVVGAEKLITLLQQRAQAAVDAGSSVETLAASGGNQLMVGLTGYPNVGKSSTINALFGSKKTAVAATPGKTKHFQTLNITDRLTLCDCPGLVLPKYAASKAEMVAAGVIPIDRLTDVRAPAEVIAQRIPRPVLEATYGMQLPRPRNGANMAPMAGELLQCIARSRGWVVGNGLPDEARSGRLLLKDYTAGKLAYCEWPPSPFVAHPGDDSSSLQADPDTAASSSGEESGTGTESSDEEDAAAVADDMPGPRLEDAALADAVSELGDADLDLLQNIQLSGKQKPRRAEHKFHKKPARSKGNRGLAVDSGGYDGAAVTYGKRGGLVRVGVPVK